MKATVLFCLSLIIGGPCWTSNAYSQIISDSVHSAAICRNYNASEATDIDYLPWAVRNLNSSSRYVICPLVVPIPPGGLIDESPYLISVNVEGSTRPNQSLTCTLFSHDAFGEFLGSDSFNIGSFTAFSYELRVPAIAPTDASVLCLLPGSAGGQLTELDLRLLPPN